MATIRVKIIGADKFAREQLKLVRDASSRQLEDIAQRTSEELKSQIEQTTTRANSTGRTKGSVFAEPIPGGWGIGNIAHINSTVPWFFHVNFGSEAIGANRNFRVPMGAFQPGNSSPVRGGEGQRWMPGTGSFSFINPKPIVPRNFIQRTLVQIPRIVDRVLSKGI